MSLYSHSPPPGQNGKVLGIEEKTRYRGLAVNAELLIFIGPLGTGSRRGKESLTRQGVFADLFNF